MSKKSLKTIKANEGSFNRRMERILEEHIRKNPTSYIIDIPEIMDMLGLHCDFESVRNYQKVHSCLQLQRKQSMDIMELLIIDNYFEEKKKEGLTEEEIYYNFIKTCRSYEIIPLYYDSEDAKYKLIDLKSFLGMLNARIKASGTELKRKFDNLNKLNEVLPETTAKDIKEIQISEDYDMLVDVKEQLLAFIPEKKKKKKKVIELEETTT